MHLLTFHYYFKVTGAEGGLFNIEFSFRPFDPDLVKEFAEMKRVAGENFERMRELLDGMLLQSEHFQCEREPTFSDSPGKSVGGYAYKGRLAGKKWQMKIVSPQVSASVKFGVYKVADKELSIDVECCLTHEWNVNALRAVLALPGVSIGGDAQRSVDSLLKLVDGATDTDAKILNLLETKDTDS